MNPCLTHSWGTARCYPYTAGDLIPSTLHMYYFQSSGIEACAEQQQGPSINLVDSALYGDFKLASIVVFHSPTEFLMSVIRALIALYNRKSPTPVSMYGLSCCQSRQWSGWSDWSYSPGELLVCLLSLVVTMPNRSFHVVEKQVAV